MNILPRYILFDVMKYIEPRSFVNYLSINKKTLEDVKEYLKYKKNLYNYHKISKTYKNSLYKMNSKQKYYYRNPYWVGRRARRDAFKTYIIKIVDIRPVERDGKKYKITYWVLCNLGKIGNTNVSYPDWTIVDNIDPKNLIPFY
tara:strand:- start:3769 stop:4200 length:432 start_codon:yes stop_codon:yes gene_type:complete